MLIIHIVIELTSLILAAANYARPSSALLKICFGLIGATLLSGSVLTIERHAHLASACISGLLYLAVVSAMLTLSHRKLIAQKYR